MASNLDASTGVSVGGCRGLTALLLLLQLVVFRKLSSGWACLKKNTIIFPYLKGKNGTLIGSLCCPSVKTVSKCRGNIKLH